MVVHPAPTSPDQGDGHIPNQWAMRVQTEETDIPPLDGTPTPEAAAGLF